MRALVLGLTVLSAGCDSPGPEALAAQPAPLGASSEPSRQPTPARHAYAEEEARWRMPGPYRARGSRAVAQNAACETCHEEEAREWRASHHRSAFTDKAFQDALGFEPTPFCRGCHAPEAADARSVTQEEAEIGVGCVSCHLSQDDLVLAASKNGKDSIESTSAHDVARSAAFARSDACASCHEFRFPDTRSDGLGAFMQTTVTEHARSASRDRSCASCHMPERQGRRPHGFDGVRDPAWLREALSVSATLTEDGRVRITLEPKGIGHAFPTGDLFRRVAVGAAVVTPTARETARDVRYLARHFNLVPGNPSRELVDDNRVFFEAVEIDLDPRGLERAAGGAETGRSIRWWVTLERVAQALEGSSPEAAVVESSMPLFSGTL